MRSGGRRLIAQLAAVALLVAAETGYGLFQKALAKERAEADLAGAIRLYERVVKEHSSDRKLAAEALLRIGECHQALGNAEAKRAYERLVREFGDQTEVAAKARTRLAELATAEPKPKFTKIRVPTRLPRLTEFALSPDGQQLAYVSGGSVWLLPIHGPSHPEIAGQPRRITEPDSTWFRTYDVTWSRDGRWLALRVWERPPQGADASVTYLAPSAGGRPQRVSLELPLGFHRIGESMFGLSPDGKWLAYGAQDTDADRYRSSIYVLPTSGGSARRLTPPITGQPDFSPDGKRIAYVARLSDPDRPDPLGRQVWVSDVGGGAPQLVYELPTPGRLRNPVWSPAGNVLAFLANPGRLYDDCGLLMLAPVGPDGRAIGTPAKIELPQRTVKKLTGWSRDNKIGLMFPTPQITALYTVPTAGGKAVQLTPRYACMPSWTPDGARIYFDGAHHAESANLEYIPATGGPVVRIPVRGPYRLTPSYPTGGVSVSPDGKKLLFQGHYSGMLAKGTGGEPAKTPDGYCHIFTVPIEGGEVTELATGMDYVYYPTWSPDGRQVAFVSDEPSIYIMPASGGQPRKLTSESDNVAEAPIAWSPDRRHLAYQTRDNQVRLLPLEGGPSRVLVEGLRGYRPHSGLAWSPDGKELAYATQDRIWKVNLATGNSQEVATGLDAVHMQMAWSPDGKTIAFSALQGGEPELWLMEDFLPLLKTPR